MFTLLLSLLNERLMQICTTAPACTARHPQWRRQALLHGIRCFSSLVVFEAAIQRCYEECIAITKGTTPPVKVILRKRIQMFHKAAEQLSADLIQLDLFFPPYSNPSLIYTVDTEEKLVRFIGVDLWLATCPQLVLLGERATFCITYPTTLPTIQHIAALTDLVHRFGEDTIGEQQRQWIVFKTQPLNVGMSQLQQLVRSELSYACLQVERSQEMPLVLQQASYAIQQYQHCRQAFAMLLQQHFALDAILQ